jgi:hypothetical protein
LALTTLLATVPKSRSPALIVSAETTLPPSLVNCLLNSWTRPWP